MKRVEDGRYRLNRREFAGLCRAATGLALVSNSCSQLVPPRLRRVGPLSTASRERVVQTSEEAFVDGLRQYRWVDGQNFVFDWRSADGHTERFGALASELVTVPVDVIVTAAGTSAVVAAKQATSTIPIVFMNLSNPIRPGIVQSLAR